MVVSSPYYNHHHCLRVKGEHKSTTTKIMEFQSTFLDYPTSINKITEFQTTLAIEKGK
jgi:hypothetical protein